MDVMALRRSLLMQMIGGGDMGAEVVKGTFTVGENDTSYIISFGKTISRYMFLVEMTDASKTDLINAGQNANKMYAFWGIFEKPKINSKGPNNNTVSYARYNASTDGATQSDANTTVNDNSLKINAAPLIGGGTAVFFQGYSYNYIIINLENV